MKQINNPQKSMQRFLARNYITLEQLADRFQTTVMQILALENSQCIPGHTYEERNISIFTCAGIDTALTEHTAVTTTRYYHRSVTHWVESALQALTSLNTVEYAAQVKANFASELAIALEGKKTPGCQSFEQAWGYWVDGTWGKCLKNLSVEGLASKELARLRIAQIMALPKEEVDASLKTELCSAVKQYVAASLEFDVYGMRHELAEEAIKKHGLDIELDYQHFN